jgi:predicted transcriptional regulator
MYTENVNRAIKLQNEINKQIDKFEWAQEELVNDLENLMDTFTSEEMDQILNWYNVNNDDSTHQYYIQAEIDHLREQEAQEAILAQWDMA